MEHLEAETLLTDEGVSIFKTPKLIPDRSPIVTGLIALIPGAGHMYLGMAVRGISYFLLAAVMAGLLYWANVTSEFEILLRLWLILGVILGLFYLWTIASAVYLSSRKSRFLPQMGLVLVLVFTYLLGWQATEVNLVKFFTEFDDTFGTFSRILWPWNSAIERDEEVQIVEAPFFNPCPEGGVESVVSEDVNGATIIVAPGCGTFTEVQVGGERTEGTPLVIEGSGFIPGEEAVLWWEDPIQSEFRPQIGGGIVTVIPDEDGSFTLEIPAPVYSTPPQAVGIQKHEVQIRQVQSIGAARLSDDFKLALDRLFVTIFQALMATSFGIILAFPISFLAARNLMWGSAFTRTIYYAVRFVMNIARSIEPIIWAVIAVIWVGLGPFAGVIALTIHTVAALGKLYSEAIESIDAGPIEAIQATGANRIQVIRYAIVPQIIPPYLSFTIYRWDINVRMSTIIGFVGGGGIGQILFQWINQSLWSSAGIAVWLIAITVALMDYGSAELRKRFV